MKNVAGWKDRREVSGVQWLNQLGLDLHKLPNSMIDRLANGDFTVLFEALGFEGPEAPGAAEVLRLPSSLEEEGTEE